MTKKWLTRGLAACLTAAMALPGTAVLAADRITLSDIVSAAKLMASGAELTAEQQAQYDLTGDGRLTLSDIVSLARRFVDQNAPSTPPSTAAPMLTLDSALAIALGDAPDSEGAQITKSVLDTENGRAVYEVDFTTTSGTRYEYDIEAYTGAIIKSAWEKQPSASGRPVSLEEAVALVLARIPGATAQDVKAEYDLDSAVPVYDIEVTYGGWQFEGAVTTRTGELIAWSEERVSALIPPQITPAEPSAEPLPSATPAVTMLPGAPTSAPSQPAMISEDEARQIALDRVPGSVASDITKCSTDREHGGVVYEIEMLSGGTEYEFVIDAATGAMREESWEKRPTPGFTGEAMSPAQAREAAAARVEGASAELVQIQRDTSGGTDVFEAYLTFGGSQYEMTFVAATGELIEWSAKLLPSPTATPAASAPSAATAPPVAATPWPAPSAAVTAAPATAAPTDVPAGPATLPPSLQPVIPEASTATTAVPAPTSTPSAPAAGLLTPEDAIAAALARVPGASASDVVKYTLEIDHGRTVYEVEIRVGGTEYEVTVDAATGAVLDVDIDH